MTNQHSHHSEPLTELAQQAIRELIEDHENAIVTRGLVVVEILNATDETRGVYAVQLGIGGELTPWDVIGLIKVVEVRSEYEIAVRVSGGHDEHDAGEDDE